MAKHNKILDTVALAEKLVDLKIVRKDEVQNIGQCYVYTSKKHITLYGPVLSENELGNACIDHTMAWIDQAELVICAIAENCILLEN